MQKVAFLGSGVFTGYFGVLPVSFCVMLRDSGAWGLPGVLFLPTLRFLSARRFSPACAMVLASCGVRLCQQQHFVCACSMSLVGVAGFATDRAFLTTPVGREAGRACTGNSTREKLESRRSGKLPGSRGLNDQRQNSNFRTPWSAKVRAVLRYVL